MRASPHRCPDYEPCIPCAQEEAFDDGYLRGVAAFVGLVDMAKAIRQRKRKCPTCRCHVSIAEERCSCCADRVFDAPEPEPFI